VARGKTLSKAHVASAKKRTPKSLPKLTKTVKAKASAPSADGKTAIVFDFSKMTADQRVTICRSVIEQALQVSDLITRRRVANAILDKVRPEFIPQRVELLDADQHVAYQAKLANLPDEYTEIKPETASEWRPPVPSEVVPEHAPEQPLPDAAEPEPIVVPPMPEHDIPESDPH